MELCPGGLSGQLNGEGDRKVQPFAFLREGTHIRALRQGRRGTSLCCKKELLPKPRVVKKYMVKTMLEEGFQFFAKNSGEEKTTILITEMSN